MTMTIKLSVVRRSRHNCQLSSGHAKSSVPTLETASSKTKALLEPFGEDNIA